MNVVTVATNCYGLPPATQLMRSGDRSDLLRDMEPDWGGLDTLLAAAEFVESQEQKKSHKLIEICGK